MTPHLLARVSKALRPKLSSTNMCFGHLFFFFFKWEVCRMQQV